MAQIGTFKRTTDGYTGTIRTFTLNRDVIIITPAIATDTENAPNYRVLADDVEIGAGWKRIGDKAGDYLSLLIDDRHSSSQFAPTCSRWCAAATRSI
jgi:uncharacterized protein (DUF736 family)